MAPEIIAAIEALLDAGIDIKKGMKSGGVIAALLSDKDLIAKLEVVFANLGAIPADVKALSSADIAPLLSVVIPKIEQIIAA